jgi:hypothetical protein
VSQTKGCSPLLCGVSSGGGHVEKTKGATDAATPTCTASNGANCRLVAVPCRREDGHAPGVAERRGIDWSNTPLAGLRPPAVSAGAAPLCGAARQLECHRQRRSTLQASWRSVATLLTWQPAVKRSLSPSGALAGEGGRTQPWLPDSQGDCPSWRPLHRRPLHRASSTTGKLGTPRSLQAALCSSSPTSAYRPAHRRCGAPPASAWSLTEAPTGCLTSCHASRGQTQRPSRCAVASQYGESGRRCAWKSGVASPCSS